TYRALIGITERVIAEARTVVARAHATRGGSVLTAATIAALKQQITDYCDVGDGVISQTRRRVLQGEQVPADEKIYSIFEPHTDLIKRGKDRKPIEFGHKVFLAESARGLITQYRVLTGNPVDHDQVGPSLKDHTKTFGRAPELYSADRGFFSAATVELCTAAGVTCVCIPQAGGKRHAEREAFEKSRPFKQGQRCRAGIEGRISVLFRGRGMKRALVEGRPRFDVLVGAAVLANNLMVIAALLQPKRTHRRRRPAA